MRFYRGMSVSSDRADAIAADIRTNGLVPSPEAEWRIVFFDRRRNIDTLRAKPDLTTKDTRDEYELSDSFICACGGETGAAWYALHHNGHDDDSSPLLITFSAEIDNVYIDGRDFLYSLFQGGRSSEREDALLRIFGRSAHAYAERAWNAPSNQESYRIAMCDLACQDPRVVLDHYSNSALVEGRFNTRFESAFLIRCPIAASRIESVIQPEDRYNFTPTLRLYDLRRPPPNSA